MLVEPRLTYLVLVRCFLNAIVAVLVCSGYYNKIPYTGCVLNNRNLFLTVSEAGKSKIKVAADPGLIKCRVLVQRQHLFTVAGSRELSWALFIRTLFPFLRVPPI